MRTKQKKLISISILFVFVFFQLFQLHATAYAGETAKDTGTNLTISGVYSGFKLTEVKEMPEIDSTVMLFSHVKTGARLMFVKNSDNERFFSISFRTPPTDNTGVNHIIEHSVLDGSKNYPVKSPFAEMLKGSLGTFINAITTNDYTTFPVSSANEKDLQNLMGVYLDAVFYPNFYTDANIFKQEGWRYQLDSKTADPSINGVVYNEMSGDYSNPQWLLNQAIGQALFPNTCYRYDSGGNPAQIPSLTREAMIATHKKNYTPSNSYIFLYGNLDITKYLETIDKNYLCKMEKSAVKTGISPQKPLAKIPDKVVSYPISLGSDTRQKTYLTLSFVTGTSDDETLNVGMDYLNYLLMGSNSAPLKKALLQKGIGQNDYGTFNSQAGIQPVLTFTAENAEESSREQFKKVIMDTLKNIVNKGFDRNYLASALAQYDFTNRLQKLVPMRGLNMSFNVMKSWLYDKDPTLYLNSDDTVEAIKKAAGNKYFENLIQKYLLSNSQNALVVLKPVPGLEEAARGQQEKKLADYKKKAGSKGVDALLKETAAYKQWQDTPNSAKALTAIPKLSIKDLKPELPDMSMDVQKDGGMEMVTHKVDLNGISGVDLYFDTSGIPQDKLHYLELLSQLLGNIDTQAMDFEELSNESLFYTSGLAFGAAAVPGYKDSNQYKPVLYASFAALDDNIPKAFSLLDEVIHHSLFENKDRIHMMVDQTKMSMQQMFTYGSGYSASRAFKSYLGDSGRYSEALSGYSYYSFLDDLSRNFDSRWQDLVTNLKEVYSMAFNKNGLVACDSGETKGITAFKSEFGKFAATLDSKPLPAQKYSFAEPQKNIAYALPVKVQTIIQCSDFKKDGFDYSGKMIVLQKILSMDYLWNKVRTAGGAYGVNAGFGADGTAVFMSASDPNLPETLDAFKGAVAYLENFNPSDAEMESYVIGALGDFMNLKNQGPLYECNIVEQLYLSGETADDLLKSQSEVLSTTVQDIRNYAGLIQKMLDHNTYFVEGSDQKIQENKQLFNVVVQPVK